MLVRSTVWLSELSELSELSDRLSDTVGQLSDTLSDTLSDNCRTTVGQLSDSTVGPLSDSVRPLSDVALHRAQLATTAVGIGAFEVLQQAGLKVGYVAGQARGGELAAICAGGRREQARRLESV